MNVENYANGHVIHPYELDVCPRAKLLRPITFNLQEIVIYVCVGNKFKCRFVKRFNYDKDNACAVNVSVWIALLDAWKLQYKANKGTQCNDIYDGLRDWEKLHCEFSDDYN